MATSAADLDLRIVQRIRLIENCMLHGGFCVHCSFVLLSQVFGKTPNFVYTGFTLGRYLISPGNTPISWGYNAVARILTSPLRADSGFSAARFHPHFALWPLFSLFQLH